MNYNPTGKTDLERLQPTIKYTDYTDDPRKFIDMLVFRNYNRRLNARKRNILYRMVYRLFS